MQPEDRIFRLRGGRNRSSERAHNPAFTLILPRQKSHLASCDVPKLRSEVESTMCGAAAESVLRVVVLKNICWYVSNVGQYGLILVAGFLFGS